MKKSVLTIYVIALLLNASCAQNPPNQVNTPEEIPFTAELLIDEMQIPWGMAFLPDGSMLVTEKSGELIHFKDGSKTEISNVPAVYDAGQGGLLDIALHPDYENTGWLYLTYAAEGGTGEGGHTELLRAKMNGNSLTNKEILYNASPNGLSGHYGSRIAFDNDGYLYFSMGERQEREINPQDITKDGGKIYRLHDDGRIPEDNPFVGTENAKTAIYTYGNRNPQGLIRHPETGAIWSHEHGPRGGDEINIIEKGANYGWPLVTYGIDYSGDSITDKTEMEGMESPIHYWVPSIAPSGMAFVTSDNYGNWKGSLLVGSLAFQYLERLEMDGISVVSRELLMEDIGRVRNVVQGPDGLIYVAVEGKGVYKLVPKN